MGVLIPQVITETKASGAHVIDGSLKFISEGKNHLDRTGVTGSGTTWTLSLWVKKQNNDCHIFGAGAGNTPGRFALTFDNSDKISVFVVDSGSTVYLQNSNAVFRDPGWYHIIVVADTTSVIPADRLIVYVNGVRITFSGGSMPANQNTHVNSAANHSFGVRSYTDSDFFSGQITNAYMIDGQALGPGYFGFSDPLTGTWRPKKFKAEGTTVNDGRSFSSIGTFTNWDDDGTYPKTELFDGTLYTGGTPNGASPDDGNPASFDFGDQRITGFQNLKINFFASSNQVNATGLASVNGIDITDEIHAAGNNTWTTVDLGTKFTTLQSFTIKNNNCYVGGFVIDGVIMQDNTTQNLDFGNNGFYLPMDGSSPIGQDKSGNGNNFTPANFGGTVTLDNPQVSGARPLLNTTQGGTQAGVGVFGSKEGFYETVSSSSGSGNPYIFDDRGTQPTLSFIRGATYTFDYSAATSHPLRFATAADAAGSTQYTNGTSVSGNVIKFTVPHNSPDTLYYYCTNHNGMGNSISVTTDETKADPYAWKCVFGLPLVAGICNDHSNQINCTSSTKAITTSNVASGAYVNHYGASTEFNGSSTFVGTADDSDFHLSTNDFTIECWARPEAYPGTYGMLVTKYHSNESNSQTFNTLHNGTYKCWFYYGANAFTLVDPNGAVQVNKWHHFAVTRENNVFRMFTDGKLVAQTTQAQTLNNGTQRLTVGVDHDDNYHFDGQILDARVYNGVCKYTTDFVPVSSDPDILPETPSGLSGSPKLTKIIDGAVSFDGDDFLKVKNHADLRFGSGDFCVEGFVFNTETSGNGTIAGLWNSAGDRRSWLLQIESDARRLRGFYSLNGSSTVQVNGTTGIMQQNSWHHVAFTRSGNDIRLFLNGIQIGSATESGSFYDNNNSDDDIGVGSAWGGSASDPITGFLSNVRIVKGSAVYTHNFTPPTSPLTNITNTKLLCCQSNKSSAIAAASPNISGVNDGTAWSSLVSGPTRYQDRVSNAFDGTTNGPGAIPAYPGTLSFNPGLSSISSVKIYGYYAGSGVTLHVNGSAQSPSSGAFTLTISTSTLDSIVWTAVDGFNYMRIDAIEIDSTVLIDPVVGPDDSNEGATNFNPFNTDINTVRGQESNHCTLNPLDGYVTTKDGNLQTNTSSGWQGIRATHGMKSGKFYWESQNDQSAAAIIGLADVEATGFVDGSIFGSGNHSGGVANPAWTWGGANRYFNGSEAGTSLSNHGVADVVQYAFDADNGHLWFGRNGFWYTPDWKAGANPAIGLNPTVTSIYTGKTYVPCANFVNGSARFNFGQKPFKFAPPDGFQPINGSTIRPEKVITRSDQYFGVTTYTGDGTSGSFNIGMKPDFVWVKKRGGGGIARHHCLQDSVRGAGKTLESSSTSAEYSDPNAITSFNYNGFSVGSEDRTNESGKTFVAWAWKAGGNKGTFNVDDVGYSSASDVNMNVGALTSSAYNQSSVWTNDLSGTPYPGQTLSRLFDGTTSTGLIPNNGTSITFSPTGFSSISKLRIYGYSYTGNANGIKVNGNDYTNLFTTGGNYAGSSKWVTIPETHLSSIVWSIESNGLENGHLGGIEVDGKLLVDSGVTPANVPSIAPTGCSVGTKQGFSIIKYDGNGTAGSSIPHGLSQIAEFVIVKDTEDTDNWQIYHVGAQTSGAKLLKFTNDSATSNNGPWNNTDPTSTVITLGGGGTNDSGNTHICYAWHSVPGLQKFGSYTGNGNANGPFIELGFRPSVIIIKRSDGGSENWTLWDADRNPHNVMGKQLYPNLSNLEADAGTNSSFGILDFVSNGVKIRGSHSSFNSSGHTFIYAAWAEAPTFNLFGGQSNAR